jgi:RimJ/RimL family protein N-acetyltransferase
MTTTEIGPAGVPETGDAARRPERIVMAGAYVTVAAGHASYMRIDPGHGVIEVGAILYTPGFQKTRGATEAMYLMARHVFEDLGYRRYEWKCNVLNDASQSAARRLGFAFEGVFRQHMIVKGRSRDTARFSMLDREWAERRREFERWLATENSDQTERQKTRLCHG